MSNSLQHSSSRRTSTLSSGLPRTYIDVGFSPGASPPTTVIAKRKDNPLIQQHCSSSSHVLELNNYPDNSNNFYNTQTNASQGRMSRTFKPYVRPAVVGVKKVACDTDEALFGPVPTMASFSQATTLPTPAASTLSFTQTPPIEQSIFDFEEITENDKETATILDDDIVFEELQWITDTMNNSNDNNDFPPSPPLSPIDLSFEDTSTLDDYVLFP